MKKRLNTTNASTTITSCKRYIYEEKGNISNEMKWALIELITVAYEIKGVDRPRACAVSFVSGTIQNAQRR